MKRSTLTSMISLAQRALLTLILIVLCSVPPLSVTILDKSRQPVSGQNRTVVCRVVGSSPTPTVTWTRNGYDIRGASIQVQRSHLEGGDVKCIDPSSKNLFSSSISIFYFEISKLQITRVKVWNKKRFDIKLHSYRGRFSKNSIQARSSTVF